jgi:hypothetical protein
VAALIERELGEKPQLVHGSYGQFKIRVADREVLDGGAMTLLGVVPTNAVILEKVGAALK